MLQQFNIQKTSASRLPSTDILTVPFGKTFTDHMFVAEFHDGQWQKADIMPYGPIPLHPSISALHYGQAIFEGMKAYKLADGRVSVFRADRNFRRFNISAERMAMPTVPEDLFMDGIKELLAIDREWIPQKDGHSLYLRPFMYATDPYLGVRPSLEYHFAILASPAGKYYTKPLKVKVETEYTRADDGGVGYAKTAGNYARSLYPFAKAQEEGYDQLLWTDAATRSYFEEAGTANLIFMIDDVIITPSVRTTVLDGITRDSILQLARHMGYKVEERRVSVQEVIEAINNNTLTEAFAAGTAATISNIGEIGYNGTTYQLPAVQTRQASQAIAQKLDDIRYGRTEDVFGWNKFF